MRSVLETASASSWNPELVSMPPILDREKAEQARKFAEKVTPAGFRGLQIAVAVLLYNFSIQEPGKDDGSKLQHRIFRLIDKELQAANPINPLPPIGFEVEIPRLVLKRQTDTSVFGEYPSFFDVLGMPRNRANKLKVAPEITFWEFSPPPSYAAKTQNTILSQLIQGGFIPSLRYSQDQEEIRRLLDSKLVSLHINLGIPESLKNDLANSDDIDPDCKLFASLFTLAFTSSERLRHRYSNIYAAIKNGEATLKGGGIGGRLEIKSLEVLSEHTYRLIEEIQLVAAALFAYLSDNDDSFCHQWKKLKDAVLTIYNTYQIDLDIVNQKIPVSRLVRQTSLSRKLRPLISAAALEIKSKIDKAA